MKWRYHIYDNNNKEVRVSEYVYESEAGALADAADHMKRMGKYEGFWHTIASHE